ncbi:MAG: hypothetical protein LC799_27480 [Actinobacteria bacterium]|nr:hypothetical protein [Actinomycetota bacterium]
MRIQREDPQGWAEYLGELTGWEAGTTTTDPRADPDRRDPLGQLIDLQR